MKPAFLCLLSLLCLESAWSSMPVQMQKKQSSVIVSSSVDINTANVQQLQTLKGIGVKKAEIIVRNRTDKGYFANVQSLCRIPGIGQKFLERLLRNNKDRITARVYH